MIRHVLLLLGFALLPCLSACGGGGEESPSPATTTSTVQMSRTAVMPTANASNATCGLTEFQAELLQRINTLRSSGATCGSRGHFAPAAPLGWSNAIALAAQRHSADMATAQYFSHTDSGGHDAGYRLKAVGYNWSAWAENIASGQTSVEQVMRDWINSPSHCANLMNTHVTEVAVACARSSNKTYWTMVLGRPA